jgi:hypothetical protein
MDHKTKLGKVSAILAATASLTLALGIQASAQTAPTAPTTPAVGNSPSTETSKITPKISKESHGRATGHHIKVEIDERTSSQHKQTIQCDQIKMGASSNHQKMSTQMKSGGDLVSPRDAASGQATGRRSVTRQDKTDEISSRQEKIVQETTSGENCFDVSNQHKEQTGIIGPLDSPPISNQHKH